MYKPKKLSTLSLQALVCLPFLHRVPSPLTYLVSFRSKLIWRDQRDKSLCLGALAASVLFLFFLSIGEGVSKGDVVRPSVSRRCVGGSFIVRCVGEPWGRGGVKDEAFNNNGNKMNSDKEHRVFQFCWWKAE